jgi:hypothetical protein
MLLPTDKSLQTLSRLLLMGPDCTLLEEIADLRAEERASFLKLANANHVKVRALKALRAPAAGLGFADLALWVKTSLAQEEASISAAVTKLAEICVELECSGCPVTVLKSLDHWPDLGRDLDLYTGASMPAIKQVLVGRFQARVLPRSLGDCLANKCSFKIAALDRTIEMHSGRLGQAGEHVALAARVEQRRKLRRIEAKQFYVPAAEEQVIAATLQRMYRHLFFRICDIVNTAQLVEEKAIDYAELKRAAQEARVWTGVSTFLVIVSDYVRRYRNRALELPSDVLAASLFGANKFFVRGQYLRLPLLPEAVRLYGRQITGTALGGNLSAAVRLSLLPPLASVAALAYKFTGSNQGIW